LFTLKQNSLTLSESWKWDQNKYELTATRIANDRSREKKQNAEHSWLKHFIFLQVIVLPVEKLLVYRVSVTALMINGW